jgi:hypothetical protein
MQLLLGVTGWFLISLHDDLLADFVKDTGQEPTWRWRWLGPGLIQLAGVALIAGSVVKPWSLSW